MVATYTGLATIHALASFGFGEWPGVLATSSDVFLVALTLYWAPSLGWTAEFLIVRWLVQLRFPVVPTGSRVLAASLSASLISATLLMLDVFIGQELTAGAMLWFILAIPAAATALILPIVYGAAHRAG